MAIVIQEKKLTREMPYALTDRFDEIPKGTIPISVPCPCGNNTLIGYTTKELQGLAFHELVWNAGYKSILVGSEKK
jgi:hypothetical protein